MALPRSLAQGLLPTEVEYLATSNVEINIVPLMRMDRVRLLDGVFGPLRPPAQARVPLWMALNMKKRKRCAIVCPEWMEKDNLRKMLLKETMNDAFAPLPLHYMAIAKVLLETASDDIADGDDVRNFLKSIREARQSKVLTGVEAINTEHLEITNISLGEVTELRQFLGTAFSHLRAIQRAGETDEPESSYAQAEIDERHVIFNFRREGSPSDAAAPASSRADAGDLPAWMTMPPQRNYDQQYSSDVAQQQSAEGTATGEESMNNMDLF